MSDDVTLQTQDWLSGGDDLAGPSRLGLALAWSIEEPHRVGEVVLPARTEILGRDAAPGPSRSALLQQRPGRNHLSGPLSGRGISRDQLSLRPDGSQLILRNLGRGALLVNGAERPAQQDVPVREGDRVAIQRKALFLVVRRPAALPAMLPNAGSASLDSPFGRADRHGIVGESPAAWALREALAFAGPRDIHTLLLGPSGTGKELAARALHELSTRRDGAFVSRNAATLPEGIVDAELFGNARNYPNPGMAERHGLVGAAHQGSFFLDEIGELPHALQARLLRVLDADGEYQRLGEARTRRSDLRLIAATNQAPTQLKHDFNARFRLFVELPPLQERREDIPLLVYHLLRAACADPELAGRYLDEGGYARVSPALMEALLRHDYTHHVRELDALLWASLSSSGERFLDLTDAVRRRLTVGGDSWTDWLGRPAADIPPEVLQACLDAHNGSQKDTCEALGLESRHQLARLVKKYGLVIRRGG